MNDEYGRDAARKAADYIWYQYHRVKSDTGIDDENDVMGRALQLAERAGLIVVLDPDAKHRLRNSGFEMSLLHTVACQATVDNPVRDCPVSIALTRIGFPLGTAPHGVYEVGVEDGNLFISIDPLPGIDSEVMPPGTHIHSAECGKSLPCEQFIRNRATYGPRD